MKHQKYTPENLSEKNYMFLVKLVDWKDGKLTVFEVVEDSIAAKDFTIKARNNFKSHSNCKTS